jgi:hypothetical protein
MNREKSKGKNFLGNDNSEIHSDNYHYANKRIGNLEPSRSYTIISKYDITSFH